MNPLAIEHPAEFSFLAHEWKSHWPKDHMQALRWFREAQQNELRGKPSNDFYEKALSYRYFHPSGPHVAAQRHPLLSVFSAASDLKRKSTNQESVLGVWFLFVVEPVSFLKSHLDRQLLLFSMNFTPKTRNSGWKKAAT